MRDVSSCDVILAIVPESSVKSGNVLKSASYVTDIIATCIITYGCYIVVLVTLHKFVYKGVG